jgi:hypothetical protein
LNRLHTLSLYWTSVSDAGERELKNALPRLVIER